MKLLFLFLSLSLIVNSFSQDDDNIVHYELLDNSFPITYFGGGLNYDISLNNYNFTLVGLGPNIKFIGNKFTFDADGRIHLFEHLADFSGRSPEITSIYENSRSNDASFNFGYNFLNKIKHESISLTLAGKGRTKYVTNMDVDRSYNYGISLGYTHGFTYYNFQNADQGIEITTAQGVSRQLKLASSYHKYGFIKAGLTRTIFDNISIQTDKYGKVTETSSSKISLNLLVQTSSELDDVFASAFDQGTGTTYYERQSINNVDRSNLGVSIAYELYTMNDHIIDDKIRDIGYSLELGLQPGPKVESFNNFFLDIKIKWNVGKVF